MRIKHMINQDKNPFTALSARFYSMVVWLKEREIKSLILKTSD